MLMLFATALLAFFQDVNASITVPAKIPGSRIVLNHEIVSHTNSLKSKPEQLDFLFKILPDPNSPNQNFTDKQLDVVRVLSFFKDRSAVERLYPLINFRHQKDNSAVVYALGKIGSTAPDLFIRDIIISNDQKLISNLITILYNIKGREEFISFANKLVEDNKQEWSNDKTRLVRNLATLMASRE